MNPHPLWFFLFRFKRSVTTGHLFREMDSNRSGGVTFNEFARGLGLCGVGPEPGGASQEELHGLFRSFDTNGDRVISWEEMLSGLESKFTAAGPEDTLAREVGGGFATAVRSSGGRRAGRRHRSPGRTRRRQRAAAKNDDDDDDDDRNNGGDTADSIDEDALGDSLPYISSHSRSDDDDGVMNGGDDGVSEEKKMSMSELTEFLHSVKGHSHEEMIAAASTRLANSGETETKKESTKGGRSPGQSKRTSSSLSPNNNNNNNNNNGRWSPPASRHQLEGVVADDIGGMAGMPPTRMRSRSPSPVAYGFGSGVGTNRDARGVAVVGGGVGELYEAPPPAQKKRSSSAPPGRPKRGSGSGSGGGGKQGKRGPVSRGSDGDLTQLNEMHSLKESDRAAARAQISLCIRSAVAARRSLFGSRLMSIASAFHVMDGNGNGSITPLELSMALRRLGHPLPERAIVDLVRWTTSGGSVVMKIWMAE